MEDDKLTKEEKKLEKKMRHNYLVSYSYLVASNINSLYQIYKNKSYIDMNYNIMKKISMDTFPLSEKEIKFIDRYISKFLKEQYHLKITDKEKLKVESFK